MSYNKLDKITIVLNVLSVHLGIELKELRSNLKQKENKYIFLLLLKRFNCFENDRIKEILELISDKSLRNNINKAEEKFLINKEFRRKYCEIEEGINKII